MNLALRSASLFALASLSVAPFQCPHDPDPREVREDTPGEALYSLAHEFGDAGDKQGEIRTLRYLVDRYPRSRFAVRARDELKDLGVALPEGTIQPDPTREGVPAGRLPGDPSASAMPDASAPPASSAGPAE